MSPRFIPSRDPLRVVIAGGGVAALETLIALRTLPAGAVGVTLVSATETFSYRPLAVGEPFGLGRAEHYPLARLCEDHGARFVCARVTGVRPGDHAIDLEGGQALEYDVLVAAVGARSVPAFEYGVNFDREASAQDFDEVLADLRDGMAPRVAVVVPDSVTWTLPAYELALMTSAWGERAHPDETSVVLVTHEPRPLAAFGAAVSDAVDRILEDAGVDRLCGVHPDMLSYTALRAGGGWVRADRVVALPHITGPHLHGLPSDPNGFIPVDGFGRVAGVEDVYAAGDGTTIPIKQGGLAAQLADVVARHIAAHAGEGDEPEPLRPVLRGLLRTGGGPRYLRAELDDADGTSTISEQPLWWPPSKIASRSLAPYLARLESARQRGEHAFGPAGGG
jgi:sulfide:quinone oxidoreductase